MKYLITYLFAFLLPTIACAQAVNNEEFDKNINNKIINYNYSNAFISNVDFIKLKKEINKNRPLQLPNSLGLDAYLLVRYIDLMDLTIDETIKKYKEINETARLYFFETLMRLNNAFFNKNRLKLVELIKEIKPREYEALIKEILIFYCENEVLNSNDFEKLLNKKSAFSNNEILFLEELIIVEKETNFGYELFLYFRKIDKQYIEFLFMELKDIKTPELYSKYKALLKTDLLKKCDNDVPDTWDLMGWLLSIYFDKWEIMDICAQKMAETGVCYESADFEPIEISAVDKYIRSAYLSQSLHFPIDFTIDLIQKSSIVSHKLLLIETLVNLRFDLNEKQKKRLLNQLLALKNNITNDQIETLVLAIRGINQAISLAFIKSNFVKITDNKRLENIYKNTKYNWKNTLDFCDKLDVFPPKVALLNTDLQTNFLNGYFLFKLNNECTIDGVFKANKAFLSLDLESGESPTPYDYIIKEALKDIVFPFDLKLDIVHAFEWLDAKKTKSVITIKAKNKVYSVTIIDDSAYLNNEPIYLLLNKILIDNGVAERFIKVDNDVSSFCMVLAEPNKFVKLCAALNQN